jgi:hypothetical protein
MDNRDHKEKILKEKRQTNNRVTTAFPTVRVRARRQNIFKLVSENKKFQRNYFLRISNQKLHFQKN